MAEISFIVRGTPFFLQLTYKHALAKGALWSLFPLAENSLNIFSAKYPLCKSIFPLPQYSLIGSFNQVILSLPRYPGTAVGIY